MTVAEKLTEQTGVIGEKLKSGFSKLTAPYGVPTSMPVIKLPLRVFRHRWQCLEIAKNVAMQAAAMNPIALDEDGVDASIVEKEIEIAKDQLRKKGSLRTC